MKYKIVMGRDRRHGALPLQKFGWAGVETWAEFRYDPQ